MQTIVKYFQTIRSCLQKWYTISKKQKLVNGCKLLNSKAASMKFRGKLLNII